MPNTPVRTAEGKWVLFEVSTGRQCAFWPIDAQALMACGSHSTEPPEGVVIVPPVMPPKFVGMPLRPADVGPPVVSQSPADTLTGIAPAVDGVPDGPKRGRRAAPPGKV